MTKEITLYYLPTFMYLSEIHLAEYASDSGDGYTFYVKVLDIKPYNMMDIYPMISELSLMIPMKIKVNTLTMIHTSEEQEFIITLPIEALYIKLDKVYILSPKPSRIDLIEKNLTIHLDMNPMISAFMQIYDRYIGN